MRNGIFYLFTICMTMFLLLSSYVHATEQPPSSSFINSFEEDITGDGLREYFKLQGRFLSTDSSYFQDVWLEITSPFSKEWNISFKGGYNPEITLLDLNHDQIFDLFYEVAIDEQDAQYHSQAYTLKDGKVEQIVLPKNNHIKGKYVDDFQIALTLHPNEKPIYIPVTNRQQSIQQKLYKENGKVLKEQNLVIDSIKQYVPVLISESKGYGIKSIRQVRGFHEEEVIGTIETLWYYDKKDWIILNNNWHAQ